MQRTITAELDALECPLGCSGVKDRVNIQKHLMACDAETDQTHGRLWRRMALGLWDLAPLSVRTLGQYAVQFFIADGRYRMQVFSLEDNRNGILMVYLPDVIDMAMSERILMAPIESRATGGPPASDGTDDDKVASENDGGRQIEYPIGGSRGETLRVKALTGDNMPDPPAHMKHMLGWKRKAMRVTLPAGPCAAQADAVEALCALASRAWAAAQVTPTS